MKILLLILLCILPLKIVFNDEICNIIVKMNTYTDMLAKYEKMGLKRGETKKGKLKRVNILKNKIEVLKWQQFGYKLNTNKS